MTVTITGIEFDRSDYDAEADVLYLHVGDPSRADDYDETPEGHAVRFDRDGEMVGLTLVRPKRLLKRDGELHITIPMPTVVPTAELAPVLNG
ncbi:MAG TPA: DUF2283 domain-containing protein [Thermoanaerobaculia bacterium]|nr:DUF2283 domain-containing protein [Thermoanaerobaculia bacterium]